VQQAPRLFDKECDTSDHCQNYDNLDRPTSLDTLHYLVEFLIQALDVDKAEPWPDTSGESPVAIFQTDS
jgi:hypothetical protein